MIPMERLRAQEMKVREALAAIEPPAERERAWQIYDVANGIRDAHACRWVLAATAGSVITLLTVVALAFDARWLDPTGGWTARALGCDHATAFFLIELVMLPVVTLLARFTVVPRYTLRRKIALWQELDELCAKPGTPQLLSKIADADPTFAAIAPLILVQVRR